MAKIFLILTLFLVFSEYAQAQQKHTLSSPNDSLRIDITVAGTIRWQAFYGNKTVVAPSEIGLSFVTEKLPQPLKITSVKREDADFTFRALYYKKDSVRNHYRQLTLTFRDGLSVIFRAYNDGVAYRFATTKAGEVFVKSEKAEFNFENDSPCFIPLVRDLRGSEQFIQSFEALYREKKFSELDKDTLGFLPVLVRTGDFSAVILEADLEEYPGMFLQVSAPVKNGFHGVNAPFPLEETQGGYQKMTSLVTRRADYIARVKGTRTFPWRIVVVAQHDAALADNDMVQRLASPPRIKDTSWIKPGKVAWDWWNDWNISHVDFKSGINTLTYKHYIDFASANNLDYIILDLGWSNELDIMEQSKSVDLAELIGYGKEKSVRIILWASWYAIDKKMEEAFSAYSKMGVAGFKIDFMDRDDQRVVSSLYTIAAKAAQYRLLLDFHGMYKPTGLQRTFPNVLNFEGVKGMENVKWTPHDDVPRYDVTIPFIRMVAGPMDYTPGAMRNATRSEFHPSHSLPMSQGTRCHQLAMYVVFESPLEMLSDNPTAYAAEPACTGFISGVPTVFNETKVLNGAVAEYITVARRSGSNWYVGSMSNWTPRDLTIGLSFLGNGKYRAEIFEDGVNSDRVATDFRKRDVIVGKSDVMKIHLAPGGGWAARFARVSE